MNREQRRAAEKDSLKYLQSPCTIAEAVQIARGAAEDVVHDYANNENHLKIAMSLQIEIMKEVMISAGLITEEKFREMYMKKAEEFNRMQKEMLSKVAEEGEEVAPIADTSMEMQATDIEVTTES